MAACQTIFKNSTNADKATLNAQLRTFMETQLTPTFKSYLQLHINQLVYLPLAANPHFRDTYKLKVDLHG